MKKLLTSAGLATALVLSGCQAAPTADTFLACMVAGAGGFDDKAFNETSHHGLINARDKLRIEINAVQSPEASGYAASIQSMVDDKCDVIVTVGTQFGEATEAAAKANPDVKFAVVDTSFDAPPANLKGLIFKTEEPSFMAGYAAASLSETGKVGTFGGRKIPAVTAFMSGFVQGVAYYNEQHGTSIEALGWDLASAEGEFVPGERPFGDVAGGEAVAQTLADQGADVVLPAAGASGRGALEVAKASGGKVAAIWVDTDGALSQAGFAPVIATSVVKAVDVAGYEAIKSAKAGDFANDAYVGTLANQGTDLAPFHEFEDRFSESTRSELERLRYDIMVGNVTIKV